MPDSDQKQMDVYSDMRVPFNIAAWCRQHKFSPLAVALAKTLRESTENQTVLRAAEIRDHALYEEIKRACKKIEDHDAAESYRTSAPNYAKHTVNRNVGQARRVKA